MGSKNEGNVSIEVNGNKYNGSYIVEKGMVTVSYGPKSNGPTQLGNNTKEEVAGMLLRELVLGL